LPNFGFSLASYRLGRERVKWVRVGERRRRG
jgi:hypothetical protein